MGEPGPDFYILIQIEFSKKASYKLPAPDSRSDLSAGIRSAVDRLYRRAAGATGRGEAPAQQGAARRRRNRARRGAGATGRGEAPAQQGAARRRRNRARRGAGATGRGEAPAQQGAARRRLNLNQSSLLRSRSQK